MSPMKDRAHIRVSRENFAHAYSAQRKREGKSIVLHVSLSEGGPIEIYALFVEVMGADGFFAASRSRMWPEIAARLGFVNTIASQGMTARSSPVIAQQLARIYETYLLDFECRIVDIATRNVVAEWTSDVGPSLPVTVYLPKDPMGWDVNEWLKLLLCPKDALLLQGTPRSVIDFLDIYRPIFQHLLRNTQDVHTRHTMVRLAGSVNNGSTQLAPPGCQRSVRNPSALHPSSMTTSEATKQTPVAPSALPRSSAPQHLIRNVASPDVDPARLAQDRQQPIHSGGSEKSTQQAPLRLRQRTRKPLIRGHAPSSAEFHQAKVWLNAVNGDLMRGGNFDYRPALVDSGHRDPPQHISDDEWPEFYALFTEVFQEASRVYPRLALCVCTMSENDAYSLVHDVLLAHEQKRVLDEGGRWGLFSIDRLRRIRGAMRHWGSLRV